MKIKKFKYNKEEEDIKEHEILLLEKNEKYLFGISFNYLTEEEKNKLLDIQKKYEEDLKPFSKSFRRFLVEKIINE